MKNENRKRKVAVKLDKNFLIFGSNEIRIKCQALTGYANIYGSAAIYECRSKQVTFEHFTGSNDRSFEMTMMEVHALNL